MDTPDTDLADTSSRTLGRKGIPPLARRSYNVLGVELSRETLSLVALALCAGIVLGARVQRTAAKVHGCEECERHRLETAASIRRGAAEFEAMKRDRARGGGGPGGSEGVSASPPAPSPADSGKPPIEPSGGGVVESPEGGAFPFIPPPVVEPEHFPHDPEPVDTDRGPAKWT